MNCNICGKEKDESEFYIQNNTRRGRRKECVSCLKEKAKIYNMENKKRKQDYFSKNKEKIKKYQTEYKKKNKEKIKQLNKNWRENNKHKVKQLIEKYHESHKNELKDYHKKYRSENKEKLKEQRKKYYINNKEICNKRSKNYSKNNKEKIREINKKYYQDVLKHDINHKIKRNLRKRLHEVIKGKSKHKKTLTLLGIPLNEFKKYIETKFKKGMNWDNYGLGGWHMDHIKPLSHFNLSNPMEIEKASHYTNIQPLWEYENCSKRDRFIG